MTSPGELKAKANELYDFAEAIDNDDDRLPYVLRAMELEIQAIVLEQRDTVPQPSAYADGP